MKRIKFDEFSPNWYRIASLIVAFIIIVIGFGVIGNFSSSLLVVLGILLIIFELSRLFWYQNYVKWNANRIVIRLNSFSVKAFKFNEITKVKVTSDDMVVTSKGESHILCLHRIDRNDIDDLADILVDNSDAEYVSDVMHEKFYNQS